MEKEKALEKFIDMIKKSWTYEKMTENEKENIIQEFYGIKAKDALKGTYDTRWKILEAIYSAYLNGLGYNGFNWRTNTGIF